MYIIGYYYQVYSISVEVMTFADANYNKLHVVSLAFEHVVTL